MLGLFLLFFCVSIFDCAVGQYWLDQQKMRFTPYLLLLLILVLDQPVNLPWVHNAGRPEPTEHELLQTYVHNASAVLDADRQVGKKHVLLIGSSRSMMLGEIRHHDLNADPLLDDRTRATLREFTFDPRLAFPGANLLGELIVADELTRSGVKPDLIVLELGPEFLNEVLVESSYNQNIYETDFLLRHMKSFPREMMLDAIVRIALPSYRYKFRPEAAILGGFDSEFESKRNLMSLLLGQKRSFVSEGREVRDYAGSDEIHDEAFRAQLDSIAQTLVPVRQRHHLDAMVVHLLGILKNSGIPTVMWYPPVNPQFRQTIYERHGKELDPAGFDRIVRESGLAVADSTSFEKKCNRWEDAVHPSRRCNGLIAMAILNAAAAQR